MDRILLYYKRSGYDQLFFRGRRSFRGSLKAPLLRRFEEAHHRHYETLAEVQRVLVAEGLCVHKVCRGRRVDFRAYPLVVTVGGDGTFLDAARELTRQWILGVNSAPRWSVGRFCAARAETFALLIRRVLSGRVEPRPLHRLKVRVRGGGEAVRVLNDLLFCHRNPAAMSRYRLGIGGDREEQRSSGIWIATAAGSTGAIRSAGGRKLPLSSRGIQYRPRELYETPGHRHRLRGGVLDEDGRIEVTSYMRHGMVFVDGHHVQIPMPFGATVIVASSRHPLQAVGL